MSVRKRKDLNSHKIYIQDTDSVLHDPCNATTMIKTRTKWYDPPMYQEHCNLQPIPTFSAGVMLPSGRLGLTDNIVDTHGIITEEEQKVLNVGVIVEELKSDKTGALIFILLSIMVLENM